MAKRQDIISSRKTIIESLIPKYEIPFVGEHSQIKNNIRECYLNSCNSYKEGLVQEQSMYNYLKNTKSHPLSYLMITTSGIFGMSFAAQPPFHSYEEIIEVIPKVMNQLNIDIAPTGDVFKGYDNKERKCTQYLVKVNSLDIDTKTLADLFYRIIKQSKFKYLYAIYGNYQRNWEESDQMGCLKDQQIFTIVGC